MKKLANGIFFRIFIFCSALLIGYFIGVEKTKKELNYKWEEISVDRLASTLFMLNELEKGNTFDVMRILQGSTGPNLDMIMEYLSTQDDIGFRCDLIKKLKNFRERNNLFLAGEWSYLWNIPEMKKSEEDRINFLKVKAPVACNWGASAESNKTQ